MSYKLLFTPELTIPGDPKSDILLIPVVVDDKGGTFAMLKAVKTAKQAFMFDAGFTLAQFIEEEGGFDSLKDMIEARDENAAIDRADALTEQFTSDSLGNPVRTSPVEDAEQSKLDPAEDGDEGC